MPEIKKHRNTYLYLLETIKHLDNNKKIKIYPEVKRWAATYWKILSKVWEKEPLGRKILNLNGTICCER
ncbi:MAG: hypothetical protein AB7D09_02020, partial [Methanosarcina sp.]